MQDKSKNDELAQNPPVVAQTGKEAGVVDAADDAQKVQDKSVQEQRHPSLGNTVQRKLHALAKLWMKFLAAVTSLTFSGVLSIVLGFGSWAPPPFADFVHLHTNFSLLVGGIVVLISVLALFLSRGPDPQDDQPVNEETRRYRQVVWYATGISTTSLLFSFLLVGMIILRPVWCPAWLCPAPRLIVNPNGVHDSNLELYFQTVQGSSFVFSGNPAQYTLRNLPMDISALRIDTPQQKPYRVILGIHSLQQGRFGLIIDQVVLMVKQVTLVPLPLRVWTQSEARDYHSNPYEVSYGGQDAGASLLALYTPANGLLDSRVQLIPGESDELDIQITSRVVADLYFQVSVKYRVINESKEQTIILPRIFEVVFSNTSNWHPYSIQDGHLIQGT
jgi:hypothetical protein